MTPGRRIAFEELIRFDREHGPETGTALAGVDEVGRGALAGPIVAAAVIVDPCEALDRVQDSKLVSEEERERLHDEILARSRAHGIGIVEPGEIDRINVLQATFKAMRLAVAALGTTPGFVLVDGNRLPELPVPAAAIVGGDGKSFVIASASIVAKVTRDRIMRGLAGTVRGYGFGRNKGYGTKQHLAAIEKKGLSGLHRRSFQVHAEPGATAPGRGGGGGRRRVERRSRRARGGDLSPARGMYRS